MNWDGVEAVLFDMDGTLIDTECHTDAVVEGLLAQHGIAEPAVDANTLHGLTWEAAADRVKAAHPELASVDVATAMMQGFADILDATGLTLVPGADEFVAGLHGRFRLGLYTSNVRSEVQRLKREHPAFQILETVVSGEDVRHSKPHPEGYLRLAERLGVDPGACVVFEDSAAGLKSARSAGMRTVGVVHPGTQAMVEALSDRTISDYSGLLR